MLNALRHQRNWNRPNQLSFRFLKGVLNALRHQRNWNQINRALESHLISCSTPYGIKGIGTVAIGGASSGICGSAQRLTASKELEQPAPEDAWDILRRCSTPYGIKGIGTIEIAVKLQKLESVLNALRHQRNWNWDAPRPPGTYLGVLNALRHQRNWNVYCPVGQPAYPVLVLNALRHQRNWNCIRRKTLGIAKRVLNALRHQRNWNSASLIPGQILKFLSAQRLTASKELEL